MPITLRERVENLERERAQAHRELRSALGQAARDGLTQRAIASAVGKSQPEVSRLISASAARAGDGSRRTWMTARSAVDASVRALRDGDEIGAVTMIVQALGHLSTLDDPDDRAEWAVTPARIPHRGLDTLLQELTRRQFTSTGQEPPAWADPEPLEDEWVLAALPSRVPRVKARTPPFLARLGVYVSDRDLVTA